MKQTLLLFAILLSLKTFSQFNYQPANATITSGTYSDLGTNGTAVTTNALGAAMTYNDDNSAVQNIGFSFTYNAQTFTQFVLNTNGFIKLGATAPATTNIVSILNSTETNCIAAFNMDLDAGTSPEYRVYTSGSVGSRVCTIQFKNVKDYNAIIGQYSNINFQIKLYETSNNIEFVYGTFIPSISPAIARSATVGIMGNSAALSVNITKGSSTAWTAATFMEGPYTSTTLFNHRNTTLPTAGITYKFVAQTLPINNAKVAAIYTLGKIPAGYSTPQTIQAVIKNSGSNALTNVPVTLEISGGSSFTITHTITSLPIGGFITISFDAYNPTVAGTNIVKVSVASDGVTANDMVMMSQTISPHTLSSAYGTATSSTNALGSVVATEFATKFTNAGTKSIDQITCYFPTTSTGQPYTVSIYDASGIGGFPGATPLWTSASQTTAGANANVTVVPAISVTGDFYVSVTQTGTTTIGYAYEVESPLRTNTFFVRQVASTWNDMSIVSPSNCFRLMMDVSFSGGLPITFTEVAAIKQKEYNTITWKTACETDSKGFAIQKSKDGNIFSEIGFVKTSATKDMCTNLSYSFNDNDAKPSNNYYRLKHIDNNGKETFSKTVFVKEIANSGCEIKQIYPNPAENIVKLNIASDKTQTLQLMINNVKAEKVLTKAIHTISGEQLINLDLTTLRAGAYIVVLCDINGKILSSQQIVKK